MTPVRVEGKAAAVLGEGLRFLSRVAPAGVALLLLGWLSLAFGAQRWFMLLSSLGQPAAAVGTAFFLLIAGGTALLHAGQLLLAPGVVVPAPPPVATRFRRLARVAAVEGVAAALVGLALASVDALTASALARFVAHDLIWREALWGLPSPASAWLVAWVGSCVIHTPALSWLWPATAANYPGGTLRATLSLAAGAAKRTPWLVHATLGTSLCLTGLTFWHAGFAWLALLPLVAWPAIANAAAARIKPLDEG